MNQLLKHFGRFCAFAAIATIAAAGALQAQPNASADSKSILVDGSSTVEPVTSAVAAEFAKVRPDVQVSVAVSGTSGGFRRFVVGETDISDASRAIKSSEISTAQTNGIHYVESLVAFDGLTVGVARNTQIFSSGDPCLTAGELQLLWAREAEGFVTTWNQLGSRFANAAIVLSGAAETSGTFDFFTEALNGAAGDTRADYFGTEEDQLLAEQTGADPFALTYFGFAFFQNNQGLVQSVAIDPRLDLIDAPQGALDEINARRAVNGKSPLANGGGSCNGVLPNPDTIGSFAYQPLTRPLFIYVNTQSGEREALDAYVDFYLAEERIGNEEFIADVGYVNVTPSLREAARACWDNRVTGTAFGGQFVGLSEDEIEQKYLSHCGL
ncbi:MAG TPA: substrate-binding domain-containing protein [Candidatus Bipolaricaulota bacterium]